MDDKIKFVLNGCDISFIAEAPRDITLEQLIKQTDRIKPDWCACGILFPPKLLVLAMKQMLKFSLITVELPKPPMMFLAQ